MNKLLLVLLGTIAMANTAGGSGSQAETPRAGASRLRGAANEMATTVPSPAPYAGKRGRHLRCERCGFVQAIHKVDTRGSGPVRYEMTVRMRDGTTRVDSSASAGSWRPGDYIMFMGGPTTRQAPPAGRTSAAQEAA